MILADKGYHTGTELQRCQANNMITDGAYKEQPTVKHIANEFLSESFSYDKVSDTYTCPAGAILTTMGTCIVKRVTQAKLFTGLKRTAPKAAKRIPYELNAPCLISALFSEVNSRMPSI